MGVSEGVLAGGAQAYVAEVLQAQYGRYQEYMSREADMRRELQRYITTLEVCPCFSLLGGSELCDA